MIVKKRFLTLAPSGAVLVESDKAVEINSLIFAEYDSEHRLVSAEVKPVTAVEAKGASRTSYTVKSKDNTLRVMLWNSISKMQPLEFTYKTGEVGEPQLSLRKNKCLFLRHRKADSDILKISLSAVFLP
ncbi:MAG: hypothetical protein IJH36_06725 [Clostridia bacterium]|nr:hypothetical protein [Clostridia bacterium]